MHFAEVDLDEDIDVGETSSRADIEGESEESEDEEEEGGEPDEFIDVLDILDGRGEPESEDDKGGMEREKTERDLDEEEDEELIEDEEELVAPEFSISEDEEEAEPAALANLETFITSLDAGQKRKAPDDVPGSENHERVRKRRLLKEQTQAGVESEFAAQPGKPLCFFSHSPDFVQVFELWM